MLIVEHLSITVGGRVLISNITVDAADGGRIAVLGRSGAGKTSLLRAFAGHLKPTSGSIEHRVTRGSSRIMFVAQEPVLFAALTVVENIVAFRQSAGETPAASADVLDLLLEAFDLAPLRDKLCGEISGGEQQRVTLARAVAVSPTLLLVDEPSARQDAGHRELVTTALSQAAANGVLVMSTHDPDVAAICDQVITLDEASSHAWSV
jgi:putative ABC transport system ATP-binding protein